MGKNNKKEKLAALYGKEELSDEYVSLNIDLVDLNERYHDRVKEATLSFPDDEFVKRKLREGHPIITFTPLTLPLDVLKDYSREILFIFNTYKLIPGDSFVLDNSEETDILLQKISKDVIANDEKALHELADTANLEATMLLSFGEEIIKPFLQIIARQAAAFAPFSDWTKGSCPVCGTVPSFARLSREEEGRRYLWCARCETEWNFYRIRCPFCENDQQKTLKFLTTDYREELRIDICEKCKGYVKTIDERKCSDDFETFYLTESMASLFLDIIAGENDFLVAFPDKQHVEIHFIKK